MSGDLGFTGERFVPGASGAPGEIWYEHWHRYHFAAPLVAGMRALDVACGSGYGSALLATRARHVVGVDLAPEAIAHAKARYAGVRNLEFVAGDCAALPLGDASVEAVVSFETIEHIHAQEAFLDEVARVLTPDGLLILSCPNKLEYTDKLGARNEYHVRELYRDELAALLAPRFPHLAWYGQRMSFYSLVWPEAPARDAAVFEVGEGDAALPSPGHGRPLYFIIVASRSAATLAGVAPAMSALADRDERVYGDYALAMRNASNAWSRGNALETEVAAWQGHHGEAVRQRDDLATRERALAETLAEAHREQSRLSAEIVRREGWRWWLGWPLRKLQRWLAR
jgi:SAM-dependent methyltransferase